MRMVVSMNESMAWLTCAKASTIGGLFTAIAQGMPLPAGVDGAGRGCRCW